MADLSKEHWHLSKSINVGHLITTALVVVSIFTYINQFDTRLTGTELEVRHIKEVRQTDIKRSDERYNDLKTDLKEINRKLDRIIEDK